MLKELLNQDTAPHATDILVGKLGDILIRAVGKPFELEEFVNNARVILQ